MESIAATITGKTPRSFSVQVTGKLDLTFDDMGEQQLREGDTNPSDSPVEGGGFEPSVPRRRENRFFSRPHPPLNSDGFLFTVPAWIDLHVRTDLAEEPRQHRQLLVGGVARLLVLGHRPDEPLLPRGQNAPHRCAQYDRRLDVSRVVQIVDVTIA